MNIKIEIKINGFIFIVFFICILTILWLCIIWTIIILVR
jgi:hypothetical protein